MLPAILHPPSSRLLSGTLVIRGGAVGDFVATLPLLAALRARFPGERCAVLAQPNVAPLALAAGLADEARSLESAGLAGFFAPGAEALPGEWVEWFAGFERVVSFLHDPSGTFAARAFSIRGDAFAQGRPKALECGGKRQRDTAFPARPRQRCEGGVALPLATALQGTGASPQAIARECDEQDRKRSSFARDRMQAFVAGPSRPLAGGGLAASQLAAPVIAALGLPPLRPEAFRLSLDEALIVEAREWLGAPPLLALHPGSGSARKNWPVERWIELCRAALSGRPGKILVLGGEADAAALAALRGALPAERLRVVEHAPLPRVAALLAASPRFLGHDSGLGHLAAAVGARCLLLFGGASDPVVWTPPQPGVRVLEAPNGDLTQLEVAAVREAIPW